jgi:hypothetical protein
VISKSVVPRRRLTTRPSYLDDFTSTEPETGDFRPVHAVDGVLRDPDPVKHEASLIPATLLYQGIAVAPTRAARRLARWQHN